MIKDFNWDIRDWIERTIWRKWRQTAFVAWVYSLLKPLETLSLDLKAKSLHYRRIIQHNSQQMVLSGILNEVFDSVSQRIRVETVADQEIRLYIRKLSEGIPPKVFIRLNSEVFDKVYIRYANETSGGAFIVYVPSSLMAKEDEIKAWVDYFKLADKQYTIIYE